VRRYSFRLATILRLRRAEEEQARERLGAANTTLRRLLLAQES
jgi:flagellar biosynthesis chaperone FliJ